MRILSNYVIGLFELFAIISTFRLYGSVDAVEDDDSPRPHHQPPHTHHHHHQPQMRSIKMRKCELIQTMDVNFCRGMSYNHTGMPNLVGHDTQQEAERQMKTFTPLIQYGCSPNLAILLCSAYFPMCTEKVVDLIGPCGMLCDSVKERCQPILNQFGFQWPAALNCSKFPPRNDDENMCMAGPPETPWTQQPSPTVPSRNTKDARPANGFTRTAKQCDGYRSPERYQFMNRTQKCMLKCTPDDDPAAALFTADKKRFAEVWMYIWATVCFASTGVAVLTYLIDTTRFQYPESSIVMIAFCLIVCSVAYLVRLIAGRDSIACVQFPPESSDPTVNVRLLVQDGLDKTNCTVVFILLYYFWFAGAIWLLILSLLWFLKVGLRWTHEAMYRYNTWFHIVAWSLPACLTVTVIVVRRADADELTGMCFVGHFQTFWMLVFVILPLSAILILGVLFVAAGFVVLSRRRFVAGRQRSDADEQEDGSHRDVTNYTSGGTAMPVASPDLTDSSSDVRVGVFVVVSSSFSTLAIVCYIYEYANRESWYTGSGMSRGSTDDLLRQQEHAQPNIFVLMLKISASLAVGVFSGIWMLSDAKLIQSWKNFFQHRLHMRCKKSSTTSKLSRQNKMSGGGGAGGGGGACKSNPRPPIVTSKQQAVTSPMFKPDKISDRSCSCGSCCRECHRLHQHCQTHFQKSTSRQKKKNQMELEHRTFI